MQAMNNKDTKPKKPKQETRAFLFAQITATQLFPSSENAEEEKQQPADEKPADTDKEKE